VIGMAGQHVQHPYQIVGYWPATEYSLSLSSFQQLI
jgi:hypothetical protein